MWKQPECPSTEEQMNTTKDTQTMGYYSARKRKEGVAPDAAQMNSENFMPNENKPDPQRTFTVPSHSYETSRTGRYETESGLEAKGGRGELLRNESRVSVWGDEKCWKQIMVSVAQHCACK